MTVEQQPRHRAVEEPTAHRSGLIVLAPPRRGSHRAPEPAMAGSRPGRSAAVIADPLTTPVAREALDPAPPAVAPLSVRNVAAAPTVAARRPPVRLRGPEPRLSSGPLPVVRPARPRTPTGHRGPMVAAVLVVGLLVAGAASLLGLGVIPLAGAPAAPPAAVVSFGQSIAVVDGVSVAAGAPVPTAAVRDAVRVRVTLTNTSPAAFDPTRLGITLAGDAPIADPSALVATVVPPGRTATYELTFPTPSDMAAARVDVATGATHTVFAP